MPRVKTSACDAATSSSARAEACAHPHSTTEDALISPSSSSRPQRTKRVPKRYRENSDTDVPHPNMAATELHDQEEQASTRRAKLSKIVLPPAKKARKPVVMSDGEDEDVDIMDGAHLTPIHSPDRSLPSSPLSSPPNSVAETRKRKVSTTQKARTDNSQYEDTMDGQANSEKDDSFDDKGDGDDALSDDIAAPPTKRRSTTSKSRIRVKEKQTKQISGKDERAENKPSTEDGTPMDLETSRSASPDRSTLSATTVLPIPSFTKNKPKMPPFKKNLTGTGSSAGTPGAASAPRPRPKVAESPADDKDSDFVFRKPKKETKQELNLMDKNTYASLFKNIGGSTPRSGVDVKSQEEKKKALEKLRDDDCARRAAQWDNTFNLRAQYDKITSFTERLKQRKSPAVFPNALAASLYREHESRKYPDSKVL